MQEITERVKKVMDENDLSSSQMADKIGVQRSAMSHVLSGRNKPSLDFVLKVLKSFPNISSEWLLKGQKIGAEFGEKPGPEIGDLDIAKKTQKVVEKVMVFYTDKTVEEYLHR